MKIKPPRRIRKPKKVKKEKKAVYVSSIADELANGVCGIGNLDNFFDFFPQY